MLSKYVKTVLLCMVLFSPGVFPAKAGVIHDNAVLADCPGDVEARAPSRTVIQVIDNTFHKWREYAAGEGGEFFIFQEKPGRKALRADEAAELLERSRAWEARAIPPAAEAYSLEPDDPVFDLPPGMAVLEESPAPRRGAGRTDAKARSAPPCDDGLAYAGHTQRTLTVKSTAPPGGVDIAVWPADNDGLRGGATTFTRRYNNNTVVELHAPSEIKSGEFKGNKFSSWRLDHEIYSREPHISIGIASDIELKAVYSAPVPPEGVIGDDERVRVPGGSITSYPWNTIGFTSQTFPGGVPFSATGFLVAPHTILTAAHVVYDVESGCWVDSLEFSPAQFQLHAGAGVQRPYGSRSAAGFRMSGHYPDGGGVEHDYAAAFIEEPFSGITTFMPVVFDHAPQAVNTSGYPLRAQGERTLSQWRSYDGVHDIEPRVLTYYADASPGQAGGPVWVYSVLAGRRVVAVHSRNWSDRGVGLYNGGPRMVSQIKPLIESWMQWSPVTELQDSVPVDAAAWNTKYKFNQSQHIWAAVGVRPPSGTDIDIHLYSDEDFSHLLASSQLPGSAVDFIVADFYFAPRGTYYARLNWCSGAGDGKIEWNNGADVLNNNGLNGLFVMSPDNVVRIWELHLEEGETYNLALDKRGTGDCDLRMALFRPTGGAYYAGRINSVREGLSFSYTPADTGHYGLVVFNSGGTAATSYYISVRPERWLSVASDNPGSGVDIQVWPSDNSGYQHGRTPFLRRYSADRSVTLDAPLTGGGNVFSHWLADGRFHSFNRRIAVGMDGDKEMTAVYRTQRALTVKSKNPESGVLVSVWPADTDGLSSDATEFTRRYDKNILVELQASMSAGANEFSHWLADGRFHSFERRIAVGMDGDKEMTAVYRTQRALTVKSKDPSGGVGIAVWPADNYGRGRGATEFTRSYDNNVLVELHAPLEAGGNEFSHWLVDGAFHSSERRIPVGMDRSKEMTAVYRTQRTLAVKSQNPASGVDIAVWPADNDGLSGGSTAFARIYPHNRLVWLHAPAAAGGNEFSHWLVDGAFHTFERHIPAGMDRSKEMTAVYRP